MFRPDLKPTKQEPKPRRPLRRTAIKRKTFEEVKKEKWWKKWDTKEREARRNERKRPKVKRKPQSNGATPPKNYRTSNRRKKAIPKFSDKRVVQNEEYKRKRVLFLIKNPKCAVFPYINSNQIHHKKGRIGKLLTDTRYWLAVSPAGHCKIERNPEWAYEMGFSLKRLSTT